MPRDYQCPRCAGSLAVIDSRATVFAGESSIIRRRKCLTETCGHRFTTYEVTESTITKALNIARITQALVKEITEQEQ